MNSYLSRRRFARDLGAYRARASRTSIAHARLVNAWAARLEAIMAEAAYVSSDGADDRPGLVPAVTQGVHVAENAVREYWAREIAQQRNNSTRVLLEDFGARVTGMDDSDMRAETEVLTIRVEQLDDHATANLRTLELSDYAHYDRRTNHVTGWRTKVKVSEPV